MAWELVTVAAYDESGIPSLDGVMKPSRDLLARLTNGQGWEPFQLDVEQKVVWLRHRDGMTVAWELATVAAYDESGVSNLDGVTKPSRELLEKLANGRGWEPFQLDAKRKIMWLRRQAGEKFSPFA